MELESIIDTDIDIESKDDSLERVTVDEDAEAFSHMVDRKIERSITRLSRSRIYKMKKRCDWCYLCRKWKDDDER